MKTPTLAVLIACLLGLSSAGSEKAVQNMSIIGPKTEPVALQAYNVVRYVSILRGSDENGDGSREKPWRTLTHALNAIADASEARSYALLVAEGIYDTGTIFMKEHVVLYGGFAADTWERNIQEHRTVLDGARARRVVVGADHARLDGFVVRHGLSRTHGGGILCDDTSPEISNNYIVDNFVLEPEDFNHDRIHQAGHDGGGIACRYNAVPVIRNNVIAGNQTAVGNGGGIAFFGWRRTPDVVKRNIHANRIEGGIQPVVENNVILANTVGVNDTRRTRSSNGGGISCAYESRPIIRNNVIVQNQAKGRGDGGGIYNEYYSDPLIEGNWIVGNLADDDAGGIYTMRMGQPIIRQNVIAGNRAPERGAGGIRLSKEGRARVVDNVIVRNLSGGGVQSSDSYLELEGNLIMHNEGGSAVLYETRFSYFLPSVIRDNTLRENGSEPIAIPENHGSPPIIQNNNVEGGFQGGGNFDATPAFLNNSLKGKAVSARFDAARLMTTLSLERPIENGQRLGGRVIRVEDRWSIVQTAKNRNLLVFGDLSNASRNELDWEVVCSYEMK